MPSHPDLDALVRALGELSGLSGIARADLSIMAVQGLAHDHVAIRGHPLLLRVPKQSQFALSAADNLTYQAACFARVSQSGHAPRLHGVIAPAPRIPMGALVVDRIQGRPPELPRDLRALAVAMANVHALPLPATGERAPLAVHDDPVTGALAEIEAQARFLDEAELTREARAEIEDELAWVRAFAAAPRGAHPIRLVLTDTHPGNFLIDEDGRAVIVDLEKALYGSPGTDLAHATIYSSTTWDPQSWSDLTLAEVAGFYRAYLAAVGGELALALRPWLVPMRRITMLRAITWCAKWRVLHARGARQNKHAAASTEDWSAENTDPALIAHVVARVDDYLCAPTLVRMRGEWLARPGLEDLL